MPSLQTLGLFFGASVLLALSPGPDNVFVMLHSALHGRKAGLLIVLGLCTGLLGHTAAVALGLAALLAASETAFLVLKLCGAAYLLYLAWQAFTAPAQTLAAEPARVRPGSMYRRGIFMNLTNPKVAMFFLAFLPQFTDPAQGAVAGQVAVLGFVFILATLLVFGAIAMFSGTLGALLQRSRAARRLLNWISGAVFVALAARLAMQQR